VTFAGLLLLAHAIPHVSAPILGDPVGAPLATGFLTLLIPNDLFAALMKNYVSAVVVFCIFYGVAIQAIRDKAPLLSVLEAIRDGRSRSLPKYDSVTSNGRSFRKCAKTR